MTGDCPRSWPFRARRLSAESGKSSGVSTGPAAIVVGGRRGGAPGSRGRSFRLFQMTRIIRLRPWQKAALDQFVEADKPDFLAVATPGAGKTTFALTAARHQLAGHPARLIVVAPTAHLKVQWARAAAAFSLHL